MREQPATDHLDALTSQAALFFRVGQYPLARKLAEEVRRAVPGSAPLALADATHHLARVELAAGQYRQAEDLFQHALALRRQAQGENHPSCAGSLVGLADVYLRTGDYLRTQRLALQALGLTDLASQQSLADRADATELLALLYQEMGDPERAQPLLLQVAETRRAVLGEGHLDQARALRHRGRVHTSLNQPHEAEVALEQARATERQALGESHPAYALTLAALADLRLAQKDPGGARDLYRRAAQILNATSGEWHPDFAAALDRLGRLALAEGEADEAGTLLRQAAAIRRSSLNPHHPDLAASLTALAGVSLARSEPAQAADLLLEAFAIRDRALGQVLSIGSDRQRSRHLAGLRHELDQFLFLVRDHLADSPQRVAQAYDLVLRRKAVAAEALVTQRTAILAGRYPHLGEQLARLDQLQDQITQQSLSGAEGAGPQVEKDRLEGELARQVPEMNLERRLRSADGRAVAAALPDATRLVEFVRARLGGRPARYLAFVVAPGLAEPIRMIDLGEAEAIDQQIQDFRTALTGPEADRGMVLKGQPPAAPASSPVPGSALRHQVWDPLGEALRDCPRLFLCADGDLTRLPFEVLPDAGSGRLIDRVQLSYLSSGRDLLRLAGGPSQRPPGPPLILADPDFDATGDLGGGKPEPAVPSEAACSRDLSRTGVSRLPATRPEGEGISRLLEVSPCLGAEVVKARLRATRSPRILHLATHGFFLPDQSPGSPGGEDPPFPAGRLEDPMLRSGLLLAGFNTWCRGGTPPEAAGNGLLTAAEVCTLDLVETELVVLSACETGLGEVQAGEGVFGLRRAFVLAGARTLVMSLWKVPDEQTQELMIDFYQRTLAGVPRAEALRQAQLALKERKPHPYYWGAFICQGDPAALGRPVPPGPAPPAARAQGPARPGSPEADLLAAAAAGNASEVTDLLAQGADPDARDGRGWTPLHQAAWEGHAEVVRRLLAQSAGVNVAESKGGTPLMLASEKGHEPIVRMLLERHADPNAADGHFWTALMMAIRYPYGGIVRLLLEHGADVDAVNRDGDTALMLAAEKGFTEMVRLVLERRPNVNLANAGGSTALTLASYRNHPAIAQALLDAGADINAATRHGMTSLLFAAQEGHRQVASLLLERGANVNAQNRDGRTALMWATLRHDHALAAALIEHGADPQIEDNTGHRAAALTGREAAGENAESREWLARGQLAWQGGDAGQALDCFRKASQLDAAWGEPWYAVGVVLTATGSPGDALACLRRAAELDPQHERAWHNQGVLLASLGRVAEALAAYQAAVRTNPNLEQSWHNQALLLRDLGRTEEALACHDRALQLNPQDRLAWFGKGVTLFGNGGNYEACQRAEECFVKAQELGHAEAAAYLMRCQAAILTHMGLLGCGALLLAALGLGTGVACFWMSSWFWKIAAGLLAALLLGLAIRMGRKLLGGDEKSASSSQDNRS